MTIKKMKIIKDYDEFDILILNELRKDAKISIRQLSNRIGLHANTTMQRIKRLENDGVILRYMARIDYGKLGYDFRVIISIKVKTGKDWEQSLRPLSKHPEIEGFYLVAGGPDAIIMARMRNMNELAQLLRKIQTSGVVTKTMSYIVVDTYKYPYEFNPLEREV